MFNAFQETLLESQCSHRFVHTRICRISYYKTLCNISRHIYINVIARLHCICKIRVLLGVKYFILYFFRLTRA